MKKLVAAYQHAVRTEQQPDSDSEWLLFGACRATSLLDTEVLVFVDSPFERQLEGLLREIERYKIDKIIIADTSTALMNFLRALISDGFEAVSAVSVEYRNNPYNSRKPVHGLLLVKKG